MSSRTLLTCNHCKYWQTDSELSGFGSCEHTKIAYEFDHDEIRKRSKDSLLYYDYECYGARLLTGKHFGCIHHSNKL